MALGFRPPEDQRLTRAMYLHGTDSPPQTGARDITSIDVVASPSELERMRFEIPAAGYRMERSGETTLFEGAGHRIRVTESTERTGYVVNRIGFVLRGLPSEPRRIELGATAIELHTDGSAFWIFNE